MGNLCLPEHLVVDNRPALLGLTLSMRTDGSLLSESGDGQQKMLSIWGQITGH